MFAGVEELWEEFEAKQVAEERVLGGDKDRGGEGLLIRLGTKMWMSWTVDGCQTHEQGGRGHESRSIARGFGFYG